MSEVYFTKSEEYSPMTLLSREDERRLRAQAWRHARRINSTVARTIWRVHHPRPERPQESAFSKAMRKWGAVRLLGKKRKERKLYDFSTAFYAAEVRV